MVNPSEAPATRLVALKKGMYLIRFNNVPSKDEFAVISIAPSKESEKVTVDFFPSENVKNNTLLLEDDVVVARVSGGDAIILITNINDEGQVAGVAVDKVAGAAMRSSLRGAQAKKESLAARPVNQAANAMNLSMPSIHLAGHIEMQGDVAMDVNGWLGNPNSSRRLEGFVINWANKPENVDLVYSTEVRGMGRLAPVKTGGYAGTRQKAAAISSLNIALIGENANAYQLSGVAVFTGSSPQAIVPGSDCRGSMESSQLVALKVDVVQKGMVPNVQGG